jgi:histone H3/H4
MKNIIITLSVVLLLGSCATTNQKHYYQKPNGEWISKRKLDRICKQALRNAMRSVSKEDMKILMGVPMNIDTNSFGTSIFVDTNTLNPNYVVDTPFIGDATDTIIHDIIWIEDTINGIPCRYSKD